MAFSERSSDSEILMRLSALEVFHFVSDTSMDLERYGLQTPQTKIELFLHSVHDSSTAPQLVTLAFGNTDLQETFARLEQEPFVVSVLPQHLDFLALKPWDWKGLVVMREDPKKVAHLEIKQGNQLFSLQCNQGVWASVTGEKVDEVGADAVVGLLSQLQVKQWLGSDYLGGGDSDYELSWAGSDGKARKLKLWKREGRTIGFLEGVSNDFFELETGDATLLMQPLIINASSNISNENSNVVETGHP
ncbi:MAG: DUF4340 domain-containing protein [Verrucomicrobiia bacterium]